MNERIKELAEQAEKYAEEKSTWRGDNTEWRNEFEGVFKEKFAQLIIKECLDQCYNRGMNDELYAGQLKAAAYIEEHFGIEQ